LLKLLAVDFPQRDSLSLWHIWLTILYAVWILLHPLGFTIKSFIGYLGSSGAGF